jgi:hypothetical protein
MSDEQTAADTLTEALSKLFKLPRNLSTTISVSLLGLSAAIAIGAQIKRGKELAALKVGATSDTRDITVLVPPGTTVKAVEKPAE